MCSKRKKGINVKAFNMLTNKDEAKTMTKFISCDFKYKFNRRTCNSNQKRNNKTCQCECKNCNKFKEDYSLNLSTCICENSKYLKGIAYTSVIECCKTLTVADFASAKKTDTIAANVISTASIHCHSKNVKDCSILHEGLLVIILLLIITIISCHYKKSIDEVTL